MAEANPNMEQQTLGATSAEQGYQEIELEILESCEVDEATSLHIRKCPKNPGHKGFIPVKDFKREHLPEGYRAQKLFDFIMALIGLTVKVVIKYVSRDRPDNYHLSGLRGGTVTAYGSGMVNHVARKFKDPPQEGEYCPCPLCKELPEKDREKRWWEFTVATAKHVMFNDEEITHAYIEVDYDTDAYTNQPYPKLYGLDMLESAHKKEEDVEMDDCEINVVSHDWELGFLLDGRLERYKVLRQDLEKRKFKTTEKPPVVCVSHPHGKSKHVSVGEWTGQQRTFPFRWRYTTSTCPGSSGSPVFKLGRAFVETIPGHLSKHRGGSSTYPGVNESGRFTNWLVPDSESQIPLEPEDRRFPAELRPPFRRNRPSQFFK